MQAVRGSIGCRGTLRACGRLECVVPVSCCAVGTCSGLCVRALHHVTGQNADSARCPCVVPVHMHSLHALAWSLVSVNYFLSRNGKKKSISAQCDIHLMESTHRLLNCSVYHSDNNQVGSGISGGGSGSSGHPTTGHGLHIFHCSHNCFLVCCRKGIHSILV